MKSNLQHSKLVADEGKAGKFAGEFLIIKEFKVAIRWSTFLLWCHTQLTSLHHPLKVFGDG